MGDTCRRGNMLWCMAERFARGTVSAFQVHVGALATHNPHLRACTVPVFVAIHACGPCHYESTLWLGAQLCAVLAQMVHEAHATALCTRACTHEFPDCGDCYGTHWNPEAR